MSFRLVNNIILPIEASHNDAIKEAFRICSQPFSDTAYVYRESLDCRHNRVKKVFSVALESDNSNLKEIVPYSFELPFEPDTSMTPYIIGMGPAGVFCALSLLEYGIKPVIIERGGHVEERVNAVNGSFLTGIINEESNVQFGEGGAGTFSDGKLNTGIGDPRSRKVLETYVKFGADKDILYKARPHIGTDVLRKIAVNIRNYLENNGVKILFNTKLEDIIIDNGKVKGIVCNGNRTDTDMVVLATGNGAFDVYDLILKKGISTERKAMSVGVRQEFLQSDIDRAVYGKYASSPYLEPASYQFAYHYVNDVYDSERFGEKIGLYTFCMCPGGTVINSASSNGQIVTNGMSNKARDGKNANSALLVSFTPKNEKEAIEYCRNIERISYDKGEGHAPVCTLSSLLGLDRMSVVSSKTVQPTVLPKGRNVDFDDIFPSDIRKLLKIAATRFISTMLHDRYSLEPVFTAPETRTSAPMRIKRGEDGCSLNTKGLFPCGEGAGYAGGIVSSAVDGIRIAEKILMFKR